MSEVDIGGHQVSRALVMAPVVVIFDKGADPVRRLCCRALTTPAQADVAASVAPQAMSATTIEGCQSRITVQLVSS